VTRLHWDDARQKLTREGDPGWSGPESGMVQVAGH
jgi:hypothetical protein